MAVATAVEPDDLIHLELMPGSFRAFVDALADRVRPRLKCYQGSMTLVAPKEARENAGNRLASLILAVCLEFKVRHKALESTTWDVPTWKEDTGYEADLSYYIQGFGTAEPDFRPDLAIEVLNTGRETKARPCGEALGIPEFWVLDVRRRRLTFLALATRGPNKGRYMIIPRSRALPMLKPGEVLTRLGDPEQDSGSFHEGCRQWARDVLARRSPKRDS